MKENTKEFTFGVVFLGGLFIATVIFLFEEQGAIAVLLFMLFIYGLFHRG